MNDSHLGNDLFGDDEHEEYDRQQAEPSRARTRGERRADVAPERRRRRGCGVLAFLLALVLAGAAAVAAISQLDLNLPRIGGGNSQSADYTGTGTGSVQVAIRSGDSGSRIGQRLEEAGVVKSGSAFTALFAGSREAARLQPGTYTLRKQMSAKSALDLMLDPASRKAGVTIPEGLWASEIYARLSKATGTPLADYEKVDIAELGLPAAAKGNVEGYLFPSTYTFDEDASATTQLKTLVDEFKKQTASLKIPAKTVERTLTIASLVQAESRLGEDGPKVARVIENRLATHGETIGRLQLDSTVHYGLKKRGTVTTTAAQRASENAYNTYKHAGLPPGPINNPGLDAIKAAQSPASGSWLYFVTVNLKSGETLFATTGAEHNANVKKFQAWCRDNPGSC